MVSESLKKFFYTWFFTSLDRFFYSQLFMHYLVGVSFFSSIIMINELYYIIRYYFLYNVPFTQTMSMMGALIPFLVSFSVPFGVLPAYLLLMGQLSQDSEIVAMRACGISQFRIMFPGIVFGILIMTFSYHFKNHIETYSNAHYLQLKAKVLSQQPIIQLMDNVSMNIGSIQISFDSSEKIEDREDVLYNVYAVDVKNKRTIRSEEGRIFTSPDNPEHYVVKFLRGDMNQITYKTNEVLSTNAEGVITNLNPALTNAEPNNELSPPNVTEEFFLSSFGSMTSHNYVWLPGDGFHEGPDTLTFKDLKNQIETKDANIANAKIYQTVKSNNTLINKLNFYVKYLPRALYFGAEDDYDRSTISNYINSQQEILKIAQENSQVEIKNTKANLPNYELMKLHDKIALPVIALIFALMALPLGMFSARSGRGEGLSISLVIVLVFYGFKSYIENLVRLGTLPPAGVWIPALFFGIIASVLFIQKIKE